VVWIRRSEDIVRDVASHVVDVVLPRDTCRHFLDLANRIALIEYASSISSALDVVLAASPLPLGAPCNARFYRTVEVCTLRARDGGVFAPKVVQNLVAVCGMVGVLGAEADLFLNGYRLSHCLGTCFNNWVGYSILSLWIQGPAGLLGVQLTGRCWHGQDGCEKTRGDDS
jgi:hypothetical protein